LDFLIMTFTLSRHASAMGRPFAVAIAIGTAFSSHAFAQTSQDNTLEPVVVTAARTPQKISDVLSDTVIITAEDIERSNQTSLVDLLQGQRGMEITRNGGRGASASVFLRGASNQQSIVLIDGVRTGSATTGGATWSNIPLDQIDRIEIVYGPLSSLYGADAMGGVVQIFTKKGSPAFSASASAAIGSDDLRKLDAAVSGSSRGVRYALNASHEEAAGFSSRKPGTFGYNPDHDGYERTSVGGQIDTELAQGHDLGLSLQRSRLDAEYDGSANFNDRLVQHLETYSLWSTNKLADNWTSRAQVSQSADKTENISAFAGHFDTKQQQISWQNDVTVFADDLLQVILERRREEVDSSTDYPVRARATNSVATAYQLRRGAHLGSISVRNDDNSEFGSHTTGSIGYGYRITDALRANASYGTSFRAPTFNESFFPGYGVPANQPEKGRNAEIGLTYSAGDTQWNAVYFRNRITDLIVFAAPCPVPGYAFGCAYNVNQAELTGISLGGSHTAGNLTYRASIDLQDPEDRTTGNTLARRAKKRGTFGIDYAAGASSAGVEVVLSGERFDNASNTARLPGYGVTNLHASHDIARNWTVFARWNNVFDKNYELARGYATEGSGGFVGVRYQMK
jgi:vitamin B12 transporter